MNVFKLGRARRLGGLLAGLGVLVGALVATSTAALAVRVPPAGSGAVLQPPPTLAPAVAPAVGGMPGWEITLIAVGAALVAAVLAVVADRASSARRRPPVVSGASSGPAQVSKVR
jgi:hypothetical protein